MRLRAGDDEDMVPFFVRAAKGRARSSACVLLPVFTYIVYANFARGRLNDAYREQVARWGARPWTPDEHTEYGISTYNFHRDGSGVAYSSRLRPIINQRSGFLAYADPEAGSCLRHFPADTHLLAWLEALGQDFDVITDEDLDADGVDAIAPYKVVMTTSHPEYHTPRSLDALTDYTQQGGRLMYLGGNGFYWRVALNPEFPGAVEIRRGETGIRAWAAEPGEYYNAFDGAYGGLWRNSGPRPPAPGRSGIHLTGRLPRHLLPAPAGFRRPTRRAWIFEGLARIEDEVLGDFGLSGGGAAGFELDRLDPKLGSPARSHALVLARSPEPQSPTGSRHPRVAAVVPEEIVSLHRKRPDLARDLLGEKALRDRVLRDAQRRRGVLGVRLDHVLREPPLTTNRLRQQHLAHGRQRAAPFSPPRLNNGSPSAWVIGKGQALLPPHHPRFLLLLPQPHPIDREKALDGFYGVPAHTLSPGPSASTKASARSSAATKPDRSAPSTAPLAVFLCMLAYYAFHMRQPHSSSMMNPPHPQTLPRCPRHTLSQRQGLPAAPTTVHSFRIATIAKNRIARLRRHHPPHPSRHVSACSACESCRAGTA